MKVLRAAWMREVDERAIRRIGIPSMVLMESAARGAAAVFAGRFPRLRFPNALVLAGKGNNGGDGLAIGRLLHGRGYRVEILLLADAAGLNPDPAVNLAIARNLGLPVRQVDETTDLHDLFLRVSPNDTFLVDALFGTGLREPIREGLYAEALRTVNESGLPVAAVDIPSGLSEEFLPEAGEHLSAAVTAALGALKLAHIHPDGNRFCGEIHIVDIGIPPELLADPRFDIELTDPAELEEIFAPRSPDAHKGQFGHVLSVVGSSEKPGAGVLASFAALRAGAGLSTAAVSAENRALYVQAHPEVMTLPADRLNDLLPRLEEFSCVLAGPGLGGDDRTLSLVSMLLQNLRRPLILDADAVNALANNLKLLELERPAPLVLTPHPGEFSRLTGWTPDQIRRDRIERAREFARRYRLYLVLKGHHTVVAAPEGGTLRLNPSGNPGLATAGSGDVLGGVIAGLIAQFYPRIPLDRLLAAAVFLHGYAADRAASRVGEWSLTAGDVLAALPEAFLHRHEFRPPFQLA